MTTQPSPLPSTPRSKPPATGADTFGWGTLNVPPLPPGTTYVRISVRAFEGMALRSDGVIRLIGASSWLESSIPPLPPGLSYTEIACGDGHFLALRSNGTIIGFGDDSDGQATPPPLPPGVTYVEIAAGTRHSIVRRSDGALVGFGRDGISVSLPLGITTPPVLPAGYEFGSLAAGTYRSAVLVSPTAQTLAYGIGCPGQNGITALATTDVPYVGNPAFDLAVSGGAPSSLAYLFFALAEALPPVRSATDCHIDLDPTNALVFTSVGLSPLGPNPTNPAGNAGFSVALPDHPGFHGVSLYFQAAVLDATGPFGLTLSNGLRATLN